MSAEMLVKRTASFAPFTLCRCFRALHKLVGENDSCSQFNQNHWCQSRAAFAWLIFDAPMAGGFGKMHQNMVLGAKVVA